MTDVILGNAQGNLWLQQNLVTPVRWLGWNITDPGAAGDPATEVYGAGYARQRIIFGAPAAKATVNTNNLIFSNMPACDINYLSIWDAQYGGSMVLRMPVAEMSVALTWQVLVAVADVAVSLP